MYHSSLWPQGHPWKGQSHSTWLQDEHDDPWVGVVVTFCPTGDRCADGLHYLGGW